MAETARPLLLLLAALAAACHQAGAPASSFGTLPAGTGPAEQLAGTSTGSTGGSTSPVSEDSTAAASTGASTGGGTTLALDVGVPDLPPAGPEGCRGKIDFLFVIANNMHMGQVQDKLLAAFPQFIATIEDRFADFDYHIMVVDGDQYWGVEPCNEDCSLAWCQEVDYPCDLIGTQSACDATLGAGVVFPVGEQATNARCDIAGGKRYIAKGQPDLLETFECIARVGSSGNARLGEALAAAVTPAQTGTCNAGFLRDDALLFVSLISRTTDSSYDKDPEAWAQALLDAKHGDPNAVVIFTIYRFWDDVWSDWEDCAGWWDGQGSLCQLTLSFPYHHIVDELLVDYGQAFAQATELVGEACASFIPR